MPLPTDTIPPTCGSCRFMAVLNSEPVCRFHAPQPGNWRLGVTWPPVDWNDWCGQYQTATERQP